MERNRSTVLGWPVGHTGSRSFVRSFVRSVRKKNRNVVLASVFGGLGVGRCRGV